MTESAMIGRDESMISRLEVSARGGGAAVVASKLAELRIFLQEDLRQVEEDLRALEVRATPLHQSAHHLLDLGGKRLRPTCVVLASRAGEGFGPTAREVAVAVELVHNATLLHDDVVDVGELRRGAPTARVLYGNAASIFAGDWLLVDALQRIQRAGVSGLLEKMLAVLKEMLDAEALQLANRGKLRVSQADYFRVIEGKTASLFRWGMFAGARAGSASPAYCEALACFGQSLGVAFQVIDDVLDVAGDSMSVGKTLFADLREGKVTFPLLVALERDSALEELLQEMLNGTTIVEEELVQRIQASGAIQESQALALKLSTEALEHLTPLPVGPVKDALEGVALAMLHRVK